MNEQEHEKLDELIQGFLDGDLSERQRTELRRLARHDSSLKNELHGLYRQKELLSSLPVEKAPMGLAAEVRSRLERRMILESESAVEIRPIGHAHLFLRRIAAVAAMLLIPLCILAILLFQIMKPADDVPAAGSTIAEMDTADGMRELEKSNAVESPETVAVLSIGRLTLFTDQPIAVNDAVKQAILENQLLSGASSPQWTEMGVVHQIRCSQQQMLSFSEDLIPIWPKCSRQQLVVPVGDPAVSEVVIEAIRPEQIRILISESNPVRLQMVASYMERQNRMDTADILRNIRPERESSDEVVLRPVEPKIAWDPERPDRTGSATEDGTSVSSGQTQMILIIEVKRAMGE